MLFSDQNGRISSSAPQVSMLDHGFLFGDSIYEVVRLYDGKILGWSEHRDRFISSARRVGIQLDSHFPEIERRMRDLFKSLGEPSAALRMIVTRGVGKLHIDYRTCDVPTILMAAWKFDTKLIPDSVRLMVPKIRRNSISTTDPSIKCGNYLNNVLAYKEALDAGYDDAVFLNPDSHITELTTSNIGWINSFGRICTPSTSSGILHGITRRLVIEMESLAQNKVHEALFEESEFASAEEIFVLSTFKEVLPVSEIRFSTGEVRKLTVFDKTLALQRRFRQFLDAKLAAEASIL